MPTGGSPACGLGSKRHTVAPTGVARTKRMKASGVLWRAFQKISQKVSKKLVKRTFFTDFSWEKQPEELLWQVTQTSMLAWLQRTSAA